jgi:RhtB (resistance to homoserine/threonine) family protein
MLGTQHYWLFLLSGILLNLTPGQDTLYIVGRSITQGRKAGLVSALGITSGSVIHTLAAAFGLSAILATSAAAFTVVKLVGAAYLIYLGVQMWFDRPSDSPDRPATSPASTWGIYRAGLLTNVLNPKVALFYLAFLPQFVDPTASSKLIPFLFLGATFITTGTIWCIILALAAATIASRLRTSGSTGSIIRRATGTLFVALGVRLAVAD